MGGAHAFDAGHGHGGGGAHGSSAGQDAHAHGGEIPPAPARRSITPAPEDFVNLPGPSAVVYPFVWMAVGALLIVALLAGGWMLHHQEGHGDPGASSTGH